MTRDHDGTLRVTFEGIQTAKDLARKQAQEQRANILNTARRTERGHFDFSGRNLHGRALSDMNLNLANLRQANLQQADLSHATLGGASAEGADFSGASLAATDLRHLKAAGAVFQRANLRAAQLRRANLRAADLRGSDWEGAVLDCTDLREADMRGAVGLDKVVFGTDHTRWSKPRAWPTSILWDAATRWPDGFDPHTGTYAPPPDQKGGGGVFEEETVAAPIAVAAEPRKVLIGPFEFETDQAKTEPPAAAAPGGRKCSVCHSPFRAEIEQTVAAGVSLRTVEEKWRVSRSAVSRHRQHCGN